MAQEWITMYHPETEGVAEATLAAFDAVWQEKGWQRVDKSNADLASLNKIRLQDLAKDRGIDTTNLKTKDDLVKALRKDAAPSTSEEGKA